LDETGKSEIVVIGDGWAALGAVGWCAVTGTPVRWIAGAGARMLAPLPALATGPGARGWTELARKLGIDPGEERSGTFLREFRNKAFREPQWVSAEDEAGRREGRNERLSGAERRLVPLFETRFELSLGELEEAIRAALLEHPLVQRLEGVPVAAVSSDRGRVTGLRLVSGEELACERVIHADRSNQLLRIEGVPKRGLLDRKLEPTGVLQTVFMHDKPVGVGMLEGFYAAMTRDAGEEAERHLFGWFSADGLRSVWTLCLAPDEVEDNHEIAKKLRRLKTTLDKMFTAGSWLPEGVLEFMANVREEQVRFEESILFLPVDGAASDEVPEPATVPQLRGFTVITDGFGPSSALEQAVRAVPPGGAGVALPEVEPRPDRETEAMHPEHAEALA
jgi:hypothetical protein